MKHLILREEQSKNKKAVLLIHDKSSIVYSELKGFLEKNGYKIFESYHPANIYISNTIYLDKLSTIISSESIIKIPDNIPYEQINTIKKKIYIEDQKLNYSMGEF